MAFSFVCVGENALKRAGSLQSKKAGGGVGGGAAPPICRASKSFMIDYVFFALLTPLKRFPVAFSFVCAGERRGLDLKEDHKGEGLVVLDLNEVWGGGGLAILVLGEV